MHSALTASRQLEAGQGARFRRLQIHKSDAQRKMHIFKRPLPSQFPLSGRAFSQWLRTPYPRTTPRARRTSQNDARLRFLHYVPQGRRHRAFRVTAVNRKGLFVELVKKTWLRPRFLWTKKMWTLPKKLKLNPPQKIHIWNLNFFLDFGPPLKNLKSS